MHLRLLFVFIQRILAAALLLKVDARAPDGQHNVVRRKKIVPCLIQSGLRNDLPVALRHELVFFVAK